VMSMQQHPKRLLRIGVPLTLVGIVGAWAANAQDPWADRVVAYDPGTTAMPGYTDPTTALGPPERFTGESLYPAVVSIFNPPWETNELVSIGEGGFLTLEFFEPITDDADHPFDVDLILFGNGGFMDDDWPNGRIGSPPVMFGTDALRVSVSADGVDFIELGEFVEGVFPTQGYLDSGPYDEQPGDRPTDFTRPVNPALTADDFAGLGYTDALALYDGSGGGTPIDIAAAGLEFVRFVRIDVLDDGNANTSLNAEIDALATVPEPATGVMVAGAVILFALRRSGG